MGGTPPADFAGRKRVVEDLDTTILVEAAAGTGKTTCMVKRIATLLREGRCTIDTMAAVTFTRKAASELRMRFQQELEKAPVGGEGGARTGRALLHIDRAFIGTIHSFCARLLRERPVEGEVALDFGEIDEIDDLLLRHEAWDEFTTRLFASTDRRLDDLARLGLGVDELRESFLRFTDYPDIERWPAPSADAIELDDARKAFQEYLRHMSGLATSFPEDKGNDRLMERYEILVRKARILDLGKDEVFMDLLDLFRSNISVVQKNWPGGAARGKKERDRWREFCAEHAAPLQERWRAQRYSAVIPLLGEGQAVYDRIRGERGVLNYQDLLLKAAVLLRNHRKVRRYFRKRFSHLLVDEFQDTDPVQAEVMMLLTAADDRESSWRDCLPRPGSLFVVGDPKQSIYRFRRADIVTYTQVKEAVDKSGGAVITLSTNFRTDGKIVRWVNTVFDQAFPSEPTPYSPRAVSMTPGRGEKVGGGFSGVHVLDIPDDRGRGDEAVDYESDFIARTIRGALDGDIAFPSGRNDGAPPWGASRPEDFLIVTWQRRNLARYADSLGKLGIDSRVSGGSALSHAGELRLLADWLKALSEPDNAVALVAVLRGGLFGVSDAELYEYRKRGGAFSYRSAIPGGLDPAVGGLFRRTYDYFLRHAAWARRMPAAAAIEKISSDLGLVERALTSPGGDIRAGTIAKAIEMLRREAEDRPSLAELGDLLHYLIEEGREFDGIPARGNAGGGVRIMNLHRVKGLEAPVVFLADPTGNMTRTPSLHIDRSGEHPLGYMEITAPRGRYGREVLAHHPDWPKLRDEERLFHVAETTRLLYVAATRAGSTLVVTRRNKDDHRSRWHFFGPHVEGCNPLPDPGQRKPPARPTSGLVLSQVRDAAAAIDGRWRTVLREQYGLEAMKKTDLPPSELRRRPAPSEHGMEWGTVIHFLLETAMRRPEIPLGKIAAASLLEQGLPSTLADHAVAAVKSVLSSEIWLRARRSAGILVEVPVTSCSAPSPDGRGGVLLKRGVIDLVFREEEGWIIVDYKTDPVEGEDLQQFAERYRSQVDGYARSWEEVSGDRVIEKGIFFTSPGRYVLL